MPPFSNLEDRRGGKSLTVKPIQTTQRMRPLDGRTSFAMMCGILSMLLALAFLPTAVLAQEGGNVHDQADLDAAAAAKARAGREALTHAPIDSQAPKAVGTFIKFDVPGAVNGTYPASINPAGAITGYY